MCQNATTIVNQFNRAGKMQKSEAIKLFGSKRNLYEALGVSRQTLFRWNNCLTQQQADQVAGAFMRINEERDRELIHVIRGWKQ